MHFIVVVPTFSDAVFFFKQNPVEMLSHKLEKGFKLEILYWLAGPLLVITYV